MIPELLTALTIGLIGSFHCIGMCGPIALALPLQREKWSWRITGGILYNLGRVVTYGLLGAIFGLAGKGLSLAGLQQWASITVGALMILSVVLPLFRAGSRITGRFFSGLTGRFITLFGNMFQNSSFPNLFLIGLVNGLLPCGLVYIAIAGALKTHDIWQGMLFMVIFGLATLPVMLAVALAGTFFRAGFRSRMRTLVRILVVLLGILFILRGLNLGIPYISPKESKLVPHEQVSTKEPCCK